MGDTLITDADELVGALAYLATDLGVRREDIKDALRGKSAALQALWQIDLKAPIPEVQAEVHHRISTLVHKISCPKGISTGGLATKRDAWFRGVVSVIFNTASLPGGKLGDRMNWLKTTVAYRVSESKTRRIRKEAEKQIAHNLLEAIGGFSSQDPADDRRLVSARQLVTRPTSAKLVQEAISNNNTVCIYGEGGVGKSALAHQIALSMFKRRLIGILRASDERLLYDDMVNLLVSLGYEPSSWTSSYCKNQIYKSLELECNLGVLIIDDVQDALVVQQIVPVLSKVRVLVTSRLSVRATGVKTVELGELTADEALSLARTYIEDFSMDEMASLMSTLGGRPLALAHAALFLKHNREISVLALCSALNTRVMHSLPPITPMEDADRSLVDLYTQIVAKLAGVGDSLWMLDRFLAVTGLSAKASRNLLQEWIESKDNSPLLKVRMLGGLKRLLDYGLIRQDEFSISMHSLTWQILRELREREVIELEDQFLIYLAEGDPSAPGQPPDIGRRDIGRLMQSEFDMAVNLLPGIKGMLCVDEKTWLVVRETLQTNGVKSRSIMRCYVRPGGFWKHDYSTDVRSRINDINEVRELYYGVKLYSLSLCLGLFGENGFEDFYNSGDALEYRAVIDADESVEEGLDRRYRSQRLIRVLFLMRNRFLGQANSHICYQLLSAIYGCQESQLYSGQVRFEPASMITLASWLIDDGLIQPAQSILSAVESEYESVSEIGLLVADVRLLSARFHARVGDLNKARSLLEFDLDQLVRGGDTARVKMKLLAEKLDVSLLAGANDADIVSLETEAVGLWRNLSSGSTDDSTRCRFKRILGRSSLAIATSMIASGLDRNDGSITAALDRAISNLAESYDLGETALSSRLEHESLRHELLLARYLRSEIDLSYIIREAWKKTDKVRSYSGSDSLGQSTLVDKQASLRCELLFFKLCIVDNSRRDIASPDVIRRLEMHFADLAGCLSGYWYAEFLATACLLLGRVGMSAKRYQEAAKDSYLIIGRLDRWLKLELCLQSMEERQSPSNLWLLSY